MGCRPIWVIAAVAAAAVLGGCSRGPSADPHAPVSPSAEKLSTLPAVVSSPVATSASASAPVSGGCAGAPTPTKVARLGGGGAGGTLPGNGSPVTVTVPVGAVVEVVVAFGQRTLSLPVIVPPGRTAITPGGNVLSPLCAEHDGDAVEARFRAISDGSRSVRSSTTDCGPCAQPMFVATIVVTPVPGQEEPLTGVASS